MNNNKPNPSLTLTINTEPLLALVREKIEELENNQPKATLSLHKSHISQILSLLNTSSKQWVELCEKISYKGQTVKYRGRDIKNDPDFITMEVPLSEGQAKYLDAMVVYAKQMKSKIEFNQILDVLAEFKQLPDTDINREAIRLMKEEAYKVVKGSI